MPVTCVDTPVSWLRLEQLSLGELADREAAAARHHLEACDVCRGAFERVTGDRRRLRPLRLETARPRRRRWAWGIGGGTVIVAAAAALLFVFRGGGPEPERSARVAIKGGGELVIGLVRERDGRIDRQPTHFSNGDRFKISVTCSRPGRVELEPVVAQGKDSAHPLGRRVAVLCGNNTLLPGAFRVTGDQPALVCVSEEPGGDAACIELSPARR